MSGTNAPPLLEDVAIDGDTLRRQGLWLPLRPVPDTGHRVDWAPDLPDNVRHTAERILPRVRERAVGAAVRAARQRLGTTGGDDN